MIGKYVTFFTLFVSIFFCIGSAHAQMTKVERGNWLLGVIFKLERMRDNALADIQRYEGKIHKCNATIGKSEHIIRLAQQKGNVKAEMIAGSALEKATQAKQKNEELKNAAALRKNRAEVALEYAKTGDKDLEAKLEQVEFENRSPDWMEKQKRLIDQRLKEPNQYISAIYKSLKTKAPPPLPPRKYDELQPGDVLLISPEDKSLWETLTD